MALTDFSVLPRTTYAWKTALVNNFQYLLGLIVTIQTASSMKDMVKVATTANITLSGTQTIDGVAVVADDRVLVKNQTAAAENGPYLVKSGAWVRTTDGDAASDFTKGFTVKVEKGTVNADKYFTLTTDGPITLGTTELTFAVFDALDATDANTAGKVVKRDGSGNFAAGTITASLSGNASTATTAAACTGDVIKANSVLAIKGGPATSGSSVAVAVDTPGSYTTGDKILSLKMGTVEKSYFDHNGKFVGNVTGNVSGTAGAISATGAYTDPFKIGTGATTIWLWADAAGKLLIKVSATAPTTDSDGTIVGTQTA